MSKSIVIGLIATFWILFINTEVVKRSTCGANEMTIECVHCGPKSCADLGYPIPCAGATARCRPHCVCIDGHVRDANDTCIPKKECIGCGGDKNATSGCGNHCGNSCSDYKENKTCLSGCRYNGCDCQTGYVFHDTLGHCVLPVDCCIFMDTLNPGKVHRLLLPRQTYPTRAKPRASASHVSMNLEANKRRNGIPRTPLSLRETCQKFC